MSKHELRSEFANFLDRLSATKRQVGAVDWDKFVIAHYPDEEVEEMRRTVARLGKSRVHRDWPELNCKLVSGWARRLKQSAGA